MLDLYQRSNWGYEENSKKQELQATTARYIIVKDAKKRHVGYVHYRFDLDHGIPVVYCYELQISSKYQKRGIGSLLIETLLSLAKNTGMHKVMATVFLFNGNSLAFFHKNGFRMDESSPQLNAEDADYVILSRWVIPGKENVSKEKENSALEDLILKELKESKITDVKEEADGESKVLGNSKQ
ncbi:hypothetical protein FO519_000048 [Halicephalobus sp. NKZ332]|nr:hypothetical protein FO519_000048 [Halicephalobus sp. NKZ332]